MPGTANGRGPGKGGRIMISLRLALGRLEDRRLPNRVCPQKAADVLGADLNRSELRRLPGQADRFQASAGAGDREN